MIDGSDKEEMREIANILIAVKLRNSVIIDQAKHNIETINHALNRLKVLYEQPTNEEET